jgi:hopanoid biosynthesis associated protein HpnK
MIAGPAAADAVARARRLPQLRVGLHLDLVDGFPVLPPSAVPGLLRRGGRFDANMARAGARFFFLPSVRRQLAAEVRAQFDAFHATGLRLDHVNSHKHMHLHPTLAALIIAIGRDYGVKAVRVPREPAGVLRKACPDERYPRPLYGLWIERLRRRLLRADLFINDNLFGLAWSGGMVERRLLSLLPHLPSGVSEIYFHPATKRTSALAAAMRGYRQEEELVALLSPSVKHCIAELRIKLVSYSEAAALT